MRKILLAVILLCVAHNSYADSWAEEYIDGKVVLQTSYNVTLGKDLKVGRGVDEDSNIYANNGDLTLPALRYESDTSEWQYSNDGSTFVDIRGPEALSHSDLSDMPDTDGTNSDHDARYYTETELGSTTSGSAGCTKLGIPIISGATYTTQCDFNKLFGSAGRASGGTITDAGSETVNVAAGTGFIKATDSDTAELLSFDWAASNGISVPTNTVRYIGIQYGTPPTVISQATQTWDLDTTFPLGSVINQAGTLYVLNDHWWVTDGMTNLIERFQSYGTERDNFVGGLILGTSSTNTTRKPTLSAGTAWSRLSEFAITAKDCSAGSTFYGFYRDGGTGWTRTAAKTDIDDFYDNNSGTLQPLDNNKYVNFWVFVEIDTVNSGQLMVIYPQTQYNTAAEAEAAAMPAFPSVWYKHGILVGRIIIKQGVTAPSSVASAFATTFNYALAADHGNLSGLSDDDHTQYWIAGTGRTGDFTTTGDLYNKADNSKHYFGAGDDGSITHTGTSLDIQSDVVTATDELNLRGGTNGIDFLIGATEEMTLTSAGLSITDALVVDTTTLVVNASGYTDKVGIGTTAPDRHLEINTGAATGGIRLSYNDADGSATTYADILVDSAGDLTLTPTGGEVILSNATKLQVNSAGDDKNIQIYHDDTWGIVTSGIIKLNATAGSVEFTEGANSHFRLKGSFGNAEMLAMCYDGSGNQFVLSNYNNRNSDHDHATCTDPTLFIHSDTDPDSDNTQWLSLAHNKTDAVMDLGLGGLQLLPSATGDVTLFGVTDVADNADGKSLYVYRKAAEGDSYFRMYVDQYKVGWIKFDPTSNWLNIDGGQININPNASGDVTFFKDAGSGENPTIQQNGYITAVTDERYIQWQVNDTTDNFELTREDSNILAFDIQMPLVVDDITASGDIKGVHKAADGTAAVADGTYVMGIGTATNGTITIKDGIITAVTECTNS
jgi:hypothetical protein